MHVYKFTNLNPFLNMCVSHAPRIQLFMLLIVAGVLGVVCCCCFLGVGVGAESEIYNGLTNLVFILSNPFKTVYINILIYGTFICR